MEQSISSGIDTVHAVYTPVLLLHVHQIEPLVTVFSGCVPSSPHCVDGPTVTEFFWKCMTCDSEYYYIVLCVYSIKYWDPIYHKINFVERQGALAKAELCDTDYCRWVWWTIVKNDCCPYAMVAPC